jgi:hypothetical protein
MPNPTQATSSHAAIAHIRDGDAQARHQHACAERFGHHHAFVEQLQRIEADQNRRAQRDVAARLEDAAQQPRDHRRRRDAAERLRPQ